MFKKYLLSNVYRDADDEAGAAAAEAARVAAAAAAAGGDPPEARDNTFQERIGELTRKRGEAERTAAANLLRAEEAERRAAAAEELLARRPKEQTPEEIAAAAARPPVVPRTVAPAATTDEEIEALLARPEVKRRIDTVAARRVEADNITAAGDKLYDKGVAAYTEEVWDKALKTFQSFDGLRADVTRALLKLDNGQDVLYHLGNRPSEIARIYKLAENDPIGMAVEIVKLGGIVKPPKKISDAHEGPDDSDTGRGGRAVKDYTDPNASMADFVAQRDADLKKRGVRI